MTKSIKGTQTEKNLLTSFAGESQARMRYTYFASVAKKEGYEQISAIFTETADQEKEHAKRMFKFLEGGMVEITASYPAGVIGNTLENLRAAAAGEHEEWSLDYPHFADVAEQEGFPMIAAMYRNISIAEKGHEERYLAFMNNIENMTVFAKEGEVVWQCRNCGYIEIGKEAPEVCPACLHQEWIFYPMLKADSAVFFNLSLYRYTLGREGQTMDWGTLCRNIGMIENIVMQMLIRLTDYKNDISVCRRKYVENVLQVQIELIYRVELLSKRKELCNIEILNKIDKMIFSYNLDFYKKFSNQAMYMVSYVKYFRKGIIFPNRFRHLLLLLQKLENSLKR